MSSPDLETLYKILSEYAKKSEFGDYTLKSERDDIVSRLNRLEKKYEVTAAKIEKWEPEWGKNIQTHYVYPIILQSFLFLQKVYLSNT